MSALKTVLVVDDSPENITLLSSLLKDHYKVKFATSGRMALAVANAQESPHLILLDLIMPELDGLETCRQLKANPKTANIPIMFVTSSSELKDEEEGFRAGAVDYIIKPFSAQILLARVATHIALQEAVNSAEAADRAKSMFLATMSHEIRTPMNGIMSMAELLAGSELTADQRDMVRVIRRSSSALLSIINDILDFSKIDAGRLDLEDIDFAPAEIFEAVGDILSARAEAKNLPLLIELDPSLPSLMRGDPTRLQQIVLNLAGNAVKFTERGSVRVRAHLAKDGLAFEVVDTGIGLSEEQQARLFQPFTQADESTSRRFGGTGLGLAISQRLSGVMGGLIGVESKLGEGSRFHVTLPLTMVDPAAPQPAVAIADATVACTGFNDAERAAITALLNTAGVTSVSWGRTLEAIQGTPDLVLASPAILSGADGPAPLVLIGGASQVKQAEILHPGLAITSLSWPLRRARLWHVVAAALDRVDLHATEQDGAVDTESWDAHSREAAEAAGAIVLFADDDETNRFVMQRYFAKWGYHADVVRDGAEALSVFRPQMHGLIITDLNMPQLDGIGLTAAIRASGEFGARMPVLGLSADALPDTRRRCLDAGMTGWLTKPIDSPVLKAHLEKWLPHAADFRRSAATTKTGNTESLDGIDRAIFDWSRVAEPFGGWNEEAREFVQDFMAELHSKLAPIADAMAAGDRARARFAAHALKGAARSVGAVRLGQTAADIQDCLDADDIAMAETFASLLQVNLDELRITLAGILKGEEA